MLIKYNHRMSKKAIIALLFLVVSAVVGCGAFFLFFSSSGGEVVGPRFYPLETFEINLTPGLSQNVKILKLKLSIELDDSVAMEDLVVNMPRIRDVIHTFLYGIRESDVENSASIHYLREELFIRINNVVKIKSVLFENLVVQ